MIEISIKRNGVELTHSDLVIYPDDMVKNVKQKIFRVYDDVELYPTFTQIVYSEIILKDEEIITNKFELATKFELDIISIFDIINVKFSKDKIIEILLNESYLEKLKNDLNEYNFRFNLTDIKFIFNTIIYSLTGDGMIVDIGLIQDYYINKIQVKKDYEIKNEIIDNLIKERNVDMNELYDFDEESNYFNVLFNILEFSYIPTFYKSGIHGNYIDLMKLFNIMELDENIVMCAYEKDKNMMPLVKINKSINDKNLIKNWIFNINKKNEKYTFKKIKGLTIKYIKNDIITSIGILRNGIVNIRIESEIKIKDVKNIINNINEIIVKINEYSVFKKSQRLEMIDIKKITIDTYSVSICTKRMINLESFKNMMRRYDINEFFILKDVISETTLSIYYTILGITDGERKGITINMTTNNKKTNSTRIEIHSGIFINQITSILQKIYLINKIIEKNEGVLIEETGKVIGESNVKELRKKGGEILSTKCQKQRQPIIGGVPLEGSYKLEFKGQTYTCPTKEYPYPSVNKYNIVCCFKKDKRNNINEENEFEIQISNIEIKQNCFVILKDNILYYVDFNNKESLENNIIFQLTKQEQEEFQRIKLELENQGIINIWSQPIPLKRIFKTGLKTVCIKHPEFPKQNPCSRYSKNNKLGFTKDGYPCCFNEIKMDFSLNENELLKQHILKTDSVLSNQRIGILPDILHKMFDKFKSKDNVSFVRIGVLNHSLIYIVIFILKTEFKINIATVYDLANYINENVSEIEFGNINNENDVKTKTEMLEMIVNNINNEKLEKLLRKFLMVKFNINQVIFDIPFVKNKSTIIYDYKNIKIDCSMDKRNGGSYVFLMRKDIYYEIIIQTSGDNTINSVFNNENNKILIEFIEKYINETCIKKIELPETYIYDSLYSLKEITMYLLNTRYEIKYQVMNNFNKIIYVGTKNKVLIPIKSEYKVENLQDIKITEIEMNIEKIIKEYDEINKIIDKRKGTRKINVIGFTKDGLMTNFGIVIPNLSPNLNINLNLDMNIIKIDNNINNNTEIKTPYDEYYEMIMKIKRYIYDIKIKLGIIFSKNEELVKYVENIIKDKKMSRYKKVKTIEKILWKLDEYLKFKTIVKQENFIEFIITSIAIEIVNDTIEMNILNNNIVLEYLDSYILRDNEKLITHMDEMLKYINE